MHSRLALTAISALVLASCSLPPSQAWRIVQTQGLVPYVAMEMGRRPFPPGVTPKRPVSTRPAAPMSSAPTSSMLAVTRPIQTQYLGATTPTVPSTQGNSTGVSVAKVAPAIETKPLVSNAPAPKPRVSSVPALPVPKPVAPAPKRTTTVAQTAPKPVSKPQVAKVTPAPKPVTPSPAPKAEAPKATAPKTETAKVEPKEEPKLPSAGNALPKGNMAAAANKVVAPMPSVEDLPEGTPLPGRPGLVNSPFAGKHQIVDVSGLKPGQEVKCPYSGKLFRVPQNVAAQQAPDPATSQPKAP
ncbi:MAG: hypothetical protein JNJ83_21615 [Verrucomicrobiaceae bacterium]|nr:hypothetical protein [Verrucomicrobiaceae bacterium]